MHTNTNPKGVGMTTNVMNSHTIHLTYEQTRTFANLTASLTIYNHLNP